MNCKKFRLYIDKLDGKPDTWQLPSTLQAHLDTCPACGAHFQLQQRLMAALENDPAPVLPANFTAKILNRLEPMTAMGRAKTYFSWKRAAVYAGGAFLIATALWLGYKNVDWHASEQRLANWLDSARAHQIQQGLAAIGGAEFVADFQRLLSKILALLPTTGDFIEKTFGKETLPQVFNLIMVLMLTYFVTRVAVFIDGWIRQGSRRSS